MTQPAPRKQFNELIDSINEMVINGVDIRHLQEIADAADKMKQHGKVLDSYIINGMVAALRGDTVETDRFFTAALKCGGRAPDTLCNYAFALNNSGRLIAAIKIIDEVVNISPGDISVVKQAIKFHLDAFDINGVWELKGRSEVLGHPYADLNIDNHLLLIDELLIEHKVNWQDLASRTEIAHCVLNKLGFHIQGRQAKLQDGILLIDFGITADIDSVFLGENAINNAIAEKSYSPVDDFLYLTCSTA